MDTTTGALRGDMQGRVAPASHESLINLLSTARAALDSNRKVAEDCIVRASALLRASTDRAASAPRLTFPPLGGLAPWQAKRVDAYITANITAKIRAAELAEHASLSTSHFFRAFRETFGEAPMAYVARRRMQHAQSLLTRIQRFTFSSGARVWAIRPSSFHSDISSYHRSHSQCLAPPIFAWGALGPLSS
jgi:AraC family transcriptional regulator